MTTFSRVEIYVGDTSPVWEIGFVISLPGARPVVLAELDSNFSCRIAVENASPAILREVTAKNEASERFRAWLTPEETLALGAGDWTVGIELRNSTLSPPLVQEVQGVVRIRSQVVSD
jgi:hypothetical protein